MENIGKLILTIGFILVVIGVVMIIGQRFGLGKLPGDIIIKKGNITVFFPVVTMIVISIVLTIIVNVIKKLL
ncbi:DUF2905 domain-containing protein [Sporosalibacterium faouarense]|uniref:DUF2905 domain-containing protein n=1 Tax=Sporosalibacterium faouarense TaxID=516123 RepID=UPI00141C791C|nr:DUF2905 domain-containing protein [Sporosalibacterium faouarense]MTI47796.1 DUF2905 domain-containing protein [Bacillota bacterium]